MVYTSGLVGKTVYTPLIRTLRYVVNVFNWHQQNYIIIYPFAVIHLILLWYIKQFNHSPVVVVRTQ